MRLTYLSLALADLESIRSYIAADHPTAARNVAQRLKESVNQLKTMPNLGKPGRVFGTRELVTPKIGKTSYVVVYRVQKDILEVLRVIPGIRDLNRLLEEEREE